MFLIKKKKESKEEDKIAEAERRTKSLELRISIMERKNVNRRRLDSGVQPGTGT